MNNQELWTETIGNIPSKSKYEIDSLDLVKKEIIEEEKKYVSKWKSFSKEKQEELILEVERIAITRPFGKLAMTKKIILIELMEG
jgi:hypothetical protein